MMEKSRNYFPLLDIGRFLAAISVLCFHYFSLTAERLERGFVQVFLENGFMGVQFFFMISGFVIFFSLQGGIKKYTLGRFLRIYPLFWFCCTVTYIITLLFSDSPLHFVTYLYNLLIVNNGKTALMIDGSYWTLTHEIFFYVYIGIFVYFFGKKYIEYFFYVWLLVLTLAVIFGLQNILFFKILLVRSGYYFIFGGLIAILITSWKTSSFYQKVPKMLALFLSMFMPLYLSVVLNNATGIITNKFGMYTKNQIAILLLLYVIFISFVHFSTYIKNKKIITFSLILGGVTYPVYLLHQRIGFIVLSFFGVYGYFRLQSVVFTVGLCVVAYYIYHFEKGIREKVYRKLCAILS